MWHYFDDEDLAAVKQVLDTGNLCAIGGQATPRFEEAFAEEFDSPHALAVCNAMAGLHCGVAAAGVEPGERVIVIDNACPHAGGNLSGGEVTGNAVTCRWHHWTFDLDTGACTDSPRTRARVRRYPTQIRDGAVWADLSSGMA